MLSVMHLNAPTGLAGAERVLLNYLEDRDRDHFMVRVTSCLNHRRMANSFTEALDRIDVPFERIPIGNTGLTWQVKKIARLIRENRVDVLHTHGYRSDVTGYAAARLAGVPVVSTVHGWTPVSLKLRAYETLDRFVLKRFDMVIAVSNRIREQLRQTGVKERRLAYLPNAVPIQAAGFVGRDTARRNLGVAPDGRIILSVGRLSPEKGLELLMPAVAGILRSDPLARLVIVGDGPQRGELTALVRELGIGDRVVFIGHTTDVAQWYAAADMFVLSSHTEGFPMALLEAMAAGLPVVATAVGGVPDIVEDGVNGCLVPAGAVARISSAMENLLADSVLRSRLGATARETIKERFSVGAWARKLEDKYQSVYANRRGRAQ